MASSLSEDHDIGEILPSSIIMHNDNISYEWFNFDMEMEDMGGVCSNLYFLEYKYFNFSFHANNFLMLHKSEVIPKRCHNNYDFGMVEKYDIHGIMHHKAFQLMPKFLDSPDLEKFERGMSRGLMNNGNDSVNIKPTTI